MPKDPSEDQPLKPGDFPVHADEDEIVKAGGERIAKACSKKTAEEMAHRLNSDEARNAEDCWSA